MEENARFQQYDRSQPWNGPNNRMLADPMPSGYRCPSNPDAAGLDADYLAIVGPKAVFRDVGSTSFRDIKDGTSNTIMLVESHSSGIHWMEPRDMTTDDIGFGVNSRAGGIQSSHPGMANVLMADGSVRLDQRQHRPGGPQSHDDDRRQRAGRRSVLIARPDSLGQGFVPGKTTLPGLASGAFGVALSGAVEPACSGVSDGVLAAGWARRSRSGSASSAKIG